MSQPSIRRPLSGAVGFTAASFDLPVAPLWTASITRRPSGSRRPGTAQRHVEGSNLVGLPRTSSVWRGGFDAARADSFFSRALTTVPRPSPRQWRRLDLAPRERHLHRPDWGACEREISEVGPNKSAARISLRRPRREPAPPYSSLRPKASHSSKSHRVERPAHPTPDDRAPRLPGPSARAALDAHLPASSLRASSALTMSPYANAPVRLRTGRAPLVRARPASAPFSRTAAQGRAIPSGSNR